MPLILFLAGSVVVYLQPSRYESTAVFKYAGERPTAEVAALLKSQTLFQRAFDTLGLSDKLGISADMAYAGLAGVVKTKVNPASETIEVKVIHTIKEDARDLAAGLIDALEAYESEVSERGFANRMTAAQQLLQVAEDDEESKRKFLANLISVRGEAPEEPAARLDIEAARKDWQNAQDRVVEGEAKLRTIAEESRVKHTWVELLSRAQISDRPVKIPADETMPGVISQSLGTGLGCALVIPYLLELLFPRVRKTKKQTLPVEFDEPLLGNATVGG